MRHSSIAQSSPLWYTLLLLISIVSLHNDAPRILFANAQSCTNAKTGSNCLICSTCGNKFLAVTKYGTLTTATYCGDRAQFDFLEPAGTGCAATWDMNHPFSATYLTQPGTVLGTQRSNPSASEMYKWNGNCLEWVSGGFVGYSGGTFVAVAALGSCVNFVTQAAHCNNNRIADTSCVKVAASSNYLAMDKTGSNVITTKSCRMSAIWTLVYVSGSACSREFLLRHFLTGKYLDITGLPLLKTLTIASSAPSDTFSNAGGGSAGCITHTSGYNLYFSSNSWSANSLSCTVLSTYRMPIWTRTPSHTATLTVSRSVSENLSASQSISLTETRSTSPTKMTQTRSLSLVPTPTHTFSWTKETRSSTPSSTSTHSLTLSLSATPTPSPTITQTPTASISRSGTSLSGTISLSTSRTQTISMTDSPSHSLSLSTTRTRSATTTDSPSHSFSRSLTQSLSLSTPQTLTPTFTQSNVATQSLSKTVSLTRPPTATATFTLSKVATPSTSHTRSKPLPTATINLATTIQLAFSVPPVVAAFHRFPPIEARLVLSDGGALADFVSSGTVVMCLSGSVRFLDEGHCVSLPLNRGIAVLPAPSIQRRLLIVPTTPKEIEPTPTPIFFNITFTHRERIQLVVRFVRLSPSCRALVHHVSHGHYFVAISNQTSTTAASSVVNITAHWDQPIYHIYSPPASPSSYSPASLHHHLRCRFGLHNVTFASPSTYSPCAVVCHVPLRLQWGQQLRADGGVSFHPLRAARINSAGFVTAESSIVAHLAFVTQLQFRAREEGTFAFQTPLLRPLVVLQSETETSSPTTPAIGSNNHLRAVILSLHARTTTVPTSSSSPSSSLRRSSTLMIPCVIASGVELTLSTSSGRKAHHIVLDDRSTVTTTTTAWPTTTTTTTLATSTTNAKTVLFQTQIGLLLDLGSPVSSSLSWIAQVPFWAEPAHSFAFYASASPVASLSSPPSHHMVFFPSYSDDVSVEKDPSSRASCRLVRGNISTVHHHHLFEATTAFSSSLTFFSFPPSYFSQQQVYEYICEFSGRESFGSLVPQRCNVPEKVVVVIDGCPSNCRPSTLPSHSSSTTSVTLLSAAAMTTFPLLACCNTTISASQTRPLSSNGGLLGQRFLTVRITGTRTSVLSSARTVTLALGGAPCHTLRWSNTSSSLSGGIRFLNFTLTVNCSLVNAVPIVEEATTKKQQSQAQQQQFLLLTMELLQPFSLMFPLGKISIPKASPRTTNSLPASPFQSSLPSTTTTTTTLLIELHSIHGCVDAYPSTGRCPTADDNSTSPPITLSGRNLNANALYPVFYLLDTILRSDGSTGPKNFRHLNNCSSNVSSTPDTTRMTCHPSLLNKYGAGGYVALYSALTHRPIAIFNLEGHPSIGFDAGLAAQCPISSFLNIRCGGHGACNAALGYCICASSPTEGYWRGVSCDQCVRGFGGADCTVPCPDACSGHGSCIASTTTSSASPLVGTCICDLGYAGLNCSLECPRFGQKICGGKGICDNVTAHCVCNATSATGYFSGTSCESCLLPYSPYPTCKVACPVASGLVCGGHGTCTNSGTCACTSGYCSSDCSLGPPCPLCPSGYWGASCNNPCPGGSATPCSNRGTCDTQRTDFGGSCVCTNNASVGSACQFPCPAFASVVCAGHGTCVLNSIIGMPSAAVCICNTGYGGASCSILCPGVLNGGTICSGHGTCVDTANGNVKCLCDFGYGSSDCSKICPGGTTYPCTGHGQCDVSSSTCTCAASTTQGYWSGTSCDVCLAGWSGLACTAKCPAAYDGATPCSGHGTCLRFSRTCECFHDLARGFWTGSFCSNCKEGYWGSDCKAQCPGTMCAPCNGHGICDQGVSGTGHCTCAPNWNDDSGSCSDCTHGTYGSDCTLSCPRSTSSLNPICGNGTCYSGAQQNGTCRCFGNYAINPRDGMCTECASGFYSRDCVRCGVSLSDNVTTPCSGHGTCADGVSGDGSCSCNLGYLGQWCNVTCPVENGATCGGHGQCDLQRGSCTCSSGWTNASSVLGACTQCSTGRFGANCAGQCPPCDYGATCDSGVTGTGICLCPPTRWGDHCQYQCFGVITLSNTSTIQVACNGHGLCNRQTGQCDCFADSNRGYYDGEMCEVCAEAYQSDNCTIQCPTTNSSSSTSQKVCNNRGRCWNGQCFDCLPLPEDYVYPVCGSRCEIFGRLACLQAHNNCSLGTWGDGGCPNICRGAGNTPCSGHGICHADSGQCFCEEETGWGTQACSVQCPIGVIARPHSTQQQIATQQPEQFYVCSARGDCQLDKSCACRRGFYGVTCELSCPLDSQDNICSGHGRCSSFNATWNRNLGGCQCYTGYAGESCEHRCGGRFPSLPCSGHGTCNGVDGSCTCITNFRAPLCEGCVAGQSGENCTTRCVFGVTNGTDCVCDPFYATESCTVQCPGLIYPRGAPSSLPSAVACNGHGSCNEGNRADGTCSCSSNYYDPACSVFCTPEICSQTTGKRNTMCHRANGSCACRDDGTEHWTGPLCDMCVEGYWGLRCELRCNCNNHGSCDQSSGECYCFRDAVRGYWSGQYCEVCAPGFIGITCQSKNIEMSLNMEISTKIYSILTPSLRERYEEQEDTGEAISFPTSHLLNDPQFPFAYVGMNPIGVIQREEEVGGFNKKPIVTTTLTFLAAHSGALANESIVEDIQIGNATHILCLVRSLATTSTSSESSLTLFAFERNSPNPVVMRHQTNVIAPSSSLRHFHAQQQAAISVSNLHTERAYFNLLDGTILHWTPRLSSLTRSSLGFSSSPQPQKSFELVPPLRADPTRDDSASSFEPSIGIFLTWGTSSIDNRSWMIAALDAKDGNTFRVFNSSTVQLIDDSTTTGGFLSPSVAQVLRCAALNNHIGVGSSRVIICAFTVSESAIPTLVSIPLTASSSFTYSTQSHHQPSSVIALTKALVEVDTLRRESFPRTVCDALSFDTSSEGQRGYAALRTLVSRSTTLYKFMLQNLVVTGVFTFNPAGVHPEVVTQLSFASSFAVKREMWALIMRPFNLQLVSVNLFGIRSVAPSVIDSAGGAMITVKGEGFSTATIDNVTCDFGTSTNDVSSSPRAQATIIDNQTLLCRAPSARASTATNGIAETCITLQLDVTFGGARSTATSNNPISRPASARPIEAWDSNPVTSSSTSSKAVQIQRQRTNFIAIDRSATLIVIGTGFALSPWAQCVIVSADGRIYRLLNTSFYNSTLVYCDTASSTIPLAATIAPSYLHYTHDGTVISPFGAPFYVAGLPAGLKVVRGNISSSTAGTTLRADLISRLPSITIQVVDSYGNAVLYSDTQSQRLIVASLSEPSFAFSSGSSSAVLTPLLDSSFNVNGSESQRMTEDGETVFANLYISRPQAGTLVAYFAHRLPNVVGEGWSAHVELTVLVGAPRALQLRNSPAAIQSWRYGVKERLLLDPEPVALVVDGGGNIIADKSLLPHALLLQWKTVYLIDEAAEDEDSPAPSTQVPSASINQSTTLTATSSSPLIVTDSTTSVHKTITDRYGRPVHILEEEVTRQSYDPDSDGAYRFGSITTQSVFGSYPSIRVLSSVHASSSSSADQSTELPVLLIPIATQDCQPGTEYAVLGRQKCLPCPPHGICDGSTDVGVEHGYYRSTPSSLEFYDCSFPLSGDSCLNGTCISGHMGPRCSVCQPGYGKTGKTCHECEHPALNIFAISLMVAVIFLIVAGFVWRALAAGEEAASIDMYQLEAISLEAAYTGALRDEDKEEEEEEEAAAAAHSPLGDAENGEGEVALHHQGGPKVRRKPRTKKTKQREMWPLVLKQMVNHIQIVSLVALVRVPATASSVFTFTSQFTALTMDISFLSCGIAGSYFRHFAILVLAPVVVLAVFSLLVTLRVIYKKRSFDETEIKVCAETVAAEIVQANHEDLAGLLDDAGQCDPEQQEHEREDATALANLKWSFRYAHHATAAASKHSSSSPSSSSPEDSSQNSSRRGSFSGKRRMDGSQTNPLGSPRSSKMSPHLLEEAGPNKAMEPLFQSAVGMVPPSQHQTNNISGSRDIDVSGDGDPLAMILSQEDFQYINAKHGSNSSKVSTPTTAASQTSSTSKRFPTLDAIPMMGSPNVGRHPRRLITTSAFDDAPLVIAAAQPVAPPFSSNQGAQPLPLPSGNPMVPPGRDVDEEANLHNPRSSRRRQSPQSMSMSMMGSNSLRSRLVSFALEDIPVVREESFEPGGLIVSHSAVAAPIAATTTASSHDDEVVVISPAARPTTATMPHHNEGLPPALVLQPLADSLNTEESTNPEKPSPPFLSPANSEQFLDRADLLDYQRPFDVPPLPRLTSERRGHSSTDNSRRSSVAARSHPTSRRASIIIVPPLASSSNSTSRSTSRQHSLVIAAREQEVPHHPLSVHGSRRGSAANSSRSSQAGVVGSRHVSSTNLLSSRQRTDSFAFSSKRRAESEVDELLASAFPIAAAEEDHDDEEPKTQPNHGDEGFSENASTLPKLFGSPSQLRMPIDAESHNNNRSVRESRRPSAISHQDTMLAKRQNSDELRIQHESPQDEAENDDTALPMHRFSLLANVLHSIAICIIVILFLFLPTVLVASIAMLQCENIDYGRLGVRSVLIQDRSIDCNSADYDAYASGAWVTAFLGCALLPAVMFMLVKLVAYASMSTAGQMLRARRLFFFTTGGFSSSYWYWEAIIQCRKALFVILLSTLPDSRSKTYSGMWLSFVFVFINSTLTPYANANLSHLEVGSLLTIAITFCLAALTEFATTNELMLLIDIAFISINLLMLIAFLLAAIYAARERLMQFSIVRSLVYSVEKVKLVSQNEKLVFEAEEQRTITGMNHRRFSLLVFDLLDSIERDEQLKQDVLLHLAAATFVGVATTASVKLKALLDLAARDDKANRNEHGNTSSLPEEHESSIQLFRLYEAETELVEEYLAACRRIKEDAQNNDRCWDDVPSHHQHHHVAGVETGRSTSTATARSSQRPAATRSQDSNHLSVQGFGNSTTNSTSYETPREDKPSARTGDHSNAGSLLGGGKTSSRRSVNNIHGCGGSGAFGPVHSSVASSLNVTRRSSLVSGSAAGVHLLFSNVSANGSNSAVLRDSMASIGDIDLTFVHAGASPLMAEGRVERLRELRRSISAASNAVSLATSCAASRSGSPAPQQERSEHEHKVAPKPSSLQQHPPQPPVSRQVTRTSDASPCLSVISAPGFIEDDDVNSSSSSEDNAVDVHKKKTTRDQQQQQQKVSPRLALWQPSPTLVVGSNPLTASGHQTNNKSIDQNDNKNFAETNDSLSSPVISARPRLGSRRFTLVAEQQTQQQREQRPSQHTLGPRLCGSAVPDEDSIEWQSPASASANESLSFSPPQRLVSVRRRSPAVAARNNSRSSNNTSHTPSPRLNEAE